MGEVAGHRGGGFASLSNRVKYGGSPSVGLSVAKKELAESLSQSGTA